MFKSAVILNKTIHYIMILEYKKPENIQFE